MNNIFKRLVAVLLATLCLFTVACAEEEEVTMDTQDDQTITDTDASEEQETVDGGEEENVPTTYMLSEITDKLKLHGRMMKTDDGITCDFTASGIEFKIYAQGDVFLKVTPTKDTYFTVWVDGKRAEERFYAPAKATSLKLASFEEEGEHTIRVLKQTEAQWSLCILNSLTFIGEMKEAPAYSDKYIEIIGDSITCGHGNLCLSGDVGEGDARGEDGTAAFPFLTAEALEADYSVVGCSGIGIDKGFTTFSEDDFYPKASYYRGRATDYDFERIPDLVIINLGTNDQTKGSTESAFKAGVQSLVEFIRSKYGNVDIVWTRGMMGDDRVEPWVKAVFDQLGGESGGLYVCDLNENREGGNGHPTEDAHILATRLLRNFIEDKQLLK